MSRFNELVDQLVEGAKENAIDAAINRALAEALVERVKELTHERAKLVQAVDALCIFAEQYGADNGVRTALLEQSRELLATN